MNDYQENSNGVPFSVDFIKQIKKMSGEIVFELSEGMMDGYSGYEKFFKKNFKKSMVKIIGEANASIVSGMLIDNITTEIKKYYLDYKDVVDV